MDDGGPRVRDRASEPFDTPVTGRADPCHGTGAWLHSRREGLRVMNKREEWFDVVDERDVATGREIRSEVHRLGLRHRATHVLVFNGRGELFLQQRALTKDMWPGVWDSSASGHVDAGEEYDACAVRELGEELGLAGPLEPQRWFRLEAAPETGMEFCWVYRLRHDGPFALQASEVRGGGWFGRERIAEWMASSPGDFASAFRVIWKRLEEAPGNGSWSPPMRDDSVGSAGIVKPIKHAEE